MFPPETRLPCTWAIPLPEAPPYPSRSFSFPDFPLSPELWRCALRMLKAFRRAVNQRGRYGSKRGDELPEELRRRETRLAKIKAAQKVVEQRARDRAAEEGKSAQEAKRAKPDDKDLAELHLHAVGCVGGNRPSGNRLSGVKRCCSSSNTSSVLRQAAC